MVTKIEINKLVAFVHYRVPERRAGWSGSYVPLLQNFNFLALSSRDREGAKNCIRGPLFHKGPVG